MDNRKQIPIFVAPVKAQGISTRENWKGKVVDIDKVDRKWLILDQTAVNSYARLTKGKCPEPGIEFYNDTIMNGRTE